MKQRSSNARRELLHFAQNDSHLLPPILSTYKVLYKV